MEHKNLQSTPTLFALLTVWGAKKDIDRAAGLLQDSIDKYYGPLDAQVWDPILSPPPETGPWPSRGILLRQAVLLTREWEKGVEGPDVRVGRVLGEIPSNRVICLGWGVATASHPTQKAFVTGHRESSGFLMWAPHIGFQKA